ncbi:MAG: alpha/beta hydrolase [Chitinophagaceae bacterium]|nr:MAG: alpha/beta hydrolase [Chitinophagaceae bacterium]
MLTGQFFQGRAFDLLLKKVKTATVLSKPKRPQTPKPPFSYKSIDLSFENKDRSIKYGGTLTLPDTSGIKKYPAVILISGSGPQDRDETIFGHKPFAIIADELSKKGFAVLRLDDRGTGKTTGNHAIANSADFANDTEAALDYLLQNKFIDVAHVGLIGHSEGGQIAPMVAAKRKEIKFIVLLAGPGIPGLDLLTEQNVAIVKSSGVDAAVAEQYGLLFKKLSSAIIASKDSAAAVENGITVLQNWQVPDSVKTLFKVDKAAGRKTYMKEMVAALYNPWFRYFLQYDPADNLKKLSCAVLALNGSKDLQVLPASNLEGIKKALQQSKTSNYEIKEIPQLNHLFQTCRQCSLDEYSTLEESFSPVALEIMSTWLLKQVK